MRVLHSSLFQSFPHTRHWCIIVAQGVQDGGGDVKLGLDPEEQFRLDKSPLFWCPLGMRVRFFRPLSSRYK